MNRALLLDPENLTTRYNFACTLAKQLGDTEGALQKLAPALGAGTYLVNHARVDPDLDCIRDDPRFNAILAEAEARLGTPTNRE
jgi:adenylate cyclase